MLEDEDGLSERGLSSSRRRYDDEEGEWKNEDPQNGSTIPCYMPAGSFWHKCTRAPDIQGCTIWKKLLWVKQGLLTLVGRRQISPWLFFESWKCSNMLSKASPLSPDYHSIYIGVPVPRGYRRKRRRRRSASSRDRASESERHYEQQERSDTDDGGHGCYESGNDNASRTSELPLGFPKKADGVLQHSLI